MRLRRTRRLRTPRTGDQLLAVVAESHIRLITTAKRWALCTSVSSSGPPSGFGDSNGHPLHDARLVATSVETPRPRLQVHATPATTFLSEIYEENPRATGEVGGHVLARFQTKLGPDGSESPSLCLRWCFEVADPALCSVMKRSRCPVAVGELDWNRSCRCRRPKCSREESGTRS